MEISRQEFEDFSPKKVHEFVLEKSLLDEEEAVKLLNNKVDGYALLHSPVDEVRNVYGLLPGPAKSLVGKLAEMFPAATVGMASGGTSAAQVVVATSGISPEDAWNDPSRMRHFLRAKKVCVSSQKGSIKKEYGLANNTFKVQDRVPVVTQVLQLWFKRKQILDKRPNVPRIPHIVISASPGMGKSRLLATLAAPHGANTSERSVKEQAIKEFSENKDNLSKKRAEFCRRISTAVGICATFNGNSGRRFDLKQIPSAPQALSMRFLWGYFCDTKKTTWQSFVDSCQDLIQELSLQNTINLILQDVGQDLDIIMCIDELMLAEDGCPCEDITDAAKDILSELVSLLDHEPRVHVVVSSLLYSSLRDFLTRSQRPVTCIDLPAISQEHLANFVKDVDPSWLENTDELDGKLGGKVKDVVLQGLFDSGGCPRLLENVVEYFTEKSESNALSSASLENLHESLWCLSVAKSCAASLRSRLQDALEKMCSCQTYDVSFLDPLVSCGLLLQSANDKDTSYALMPPLLIGMLYMHERQQTVKNLGFHILKACYEFMLLDTLVARAASVGDFFEKQSAHLLRLRLLLMHAKKVTVFELEDLLTLDGMINQTHWWKRKASKLTFEMPRNAVFPVSTVSKEQVMEALKGSYPRGGAIYIMEDDQNPAFDILIHLPDQLIAVQSRYSMDTTESSVTNAQVQKCLQDFKKYHPDLAPITPAFVVLAFRKAGAQLSAQSFAGMHVKMSNACSQIAVLVKEDVINIIPYSMRARPQLRITSCTSRAEHKTPQGAGQRRKPKEKEKQPELGQKRKNTDVQARQSKKSCSRDGG